MKAWLSFKPNLLKGMRVESSKLALLTLLKKSLLVHGLFWLFMILFRIIFFGYYNELSTFEGVRIDIAHMLFLGARIDLTLIGYIQAIPTLVLIVLYYVNSPMLWVWWERLLVYYLFIIYAFVTLILLADFGFYSYFKNRINTLFFGLFEDDTWALLETFWQNYNVPFILFGFFLYLALLFWVIKNRFSKLSPVRTTLMMKSPLLFFLLLLLANFAAIRGTTNMYPLGTMIPNVSSQEYINKMIQNSVRAFVDAYDLRSNFKNSRIDYLNMTGFAENIERAFEIHKHSDHIDRVELLNNIKYKTKKINENEYNIVVIMVESFGLPILKYQSDEFDIMGALRKHFNEDILFTNIISEGNGTIGSLESLLLNIPDRPGSFPFSQSDYAQTHFSYTPAFLYNEHGYNTSFIYGGDSTWRDLGAFVKAQGYKNVEGKQNIFRSINVTKEEESYFHPWGIYDEYLYEYILNKLENSTQKELIVALSTNNHPPYNIPDHYVSKSLIFSEDLTKHITGDLSLAHQRFRSYAYALDSLGVFLDRFKQSRFKDNTIIVVTADNNTVEGIMKYDTNPLFTSKNIPIYFYLPQALRSKLDIDTTLAGSQKDIFPTLYNLTLKDTEYVAIGADLFDSTIPHYGFNSHMIVNHGKEVRKINHLSEASEDALIEYYRATLAVTEYLIRSYRDQKRTP